MPVQNHKKTFDQINTVRRTTRQYQYNEPAIWPDIETPTFPITVSSNEYWLLGDIMNIIDPDSHIDRNKVAYSICDAIKTHTPKEIAPTTQEDWEKLFHSHTHTTEQSINIELTRFASWALTKEISIRTKKSTPTFLQEYFATPNADIDQLIKNTDDSIRINIRPMVADLTDQLRGILNRLGATNRDYGATIGSTYKWLFKKSTADIKQELKIRGAIPDYMNARLLVAYHNALWSAIDKFDTSHPQNFNLLNGFLYTTMIHSRLALNKNGGAIKNMVSTTVKQIESIRTERELEFARIYINEKLK